MAAEPFFEKRAHDFPRLIRKPCGDGSCTYVSNSLSAVQTQCMPENRNFVAHPINLKFSKINELNHVTIF